MAIKTRALAVIAAIGLVLSGIAVPAQAATPHSAVAKPRAGATCVTANAKAKVSNTNLKCIKNARGKLTWTRVTAAGRIIVTRATLASSATPAPLASSTPTQIDLAAKGPSGHEIVADPNGGGSSEVVYPDPADAEQPNSALAPAVASVTTSNLTENSVDVSFTPVAGVTGPYQVYIRYDDSFTLKGADGTSPDVHFGDLTPGWDYVACVYYLQPRESAKTCVNIHTLGVTPHTTNYLPGPINVVARAVDDTIEVTWDELANAERYSVSIEHNTSFQAGGYTEIGGQRNHIRFNSGSVSPGLAYKVRVSALLTSGEWTVETMTALYSNGSQQLPPVKLPAPTNLHVTDVTPTSVTVAWDVPSESTDVTVWSVVARHLTSFTAIGAYPNDRSFTIPNLNPGYGYEITVSGYNSNTGIWTNETKVSVLLPNA